MSFSSLHIQERSIVSEQWTRRISKTSPLTFQTCQPEEQRTHDTAAICQKNRAWPSDVLYMYLIYMHLKSEDKIFNFLNFQNPLSVNFFVHPTHPPPSPYPLFWWYYIKLNACCHCPAVWWQPCVCGGAGGAERMTEGVEKESDRVTLWQCIWGMGRMIQPQVWLLLISPWGLALGNWGVLWQQQWASHCFQERIQI